MRLTQIVDDNGKRALVVTARGESRLVKGARTTLDLAAQAIGEGVAAAQVYRRPRHRQAGQSRRGAEGEAGSDPASTTKTPRMSTSPAPALPISARPKGATRCTGISPTRRSSPTRCSMFKLGLEGGKPATGEVGVQPEWFYKGDGSILVAPERRPCQPRFRAGRRRGAGDRRHLCHRRRGQPVRLGFALGNEFSDHVTERQNYLWLAHSKLRPASVGPELLVGDLPADVHGVSRIRRGKERRLGRSRSCRANRTCRTRSPISKRTISNTRCSAGRATSTSTSSARRRCRSPSGIRTQRGRRVRDPVGAVRATLAKPPRHGKDKEDKSACVVTKTAPAPPFCSFSVAAARFAPD